MLKFVALVGVILLGVQAFGQAPPLPVPAHFQDVSKIVGKPGTANADGSYRINIPRTDVTFINTNGMPIPPDLGLTTYVAMSGTAERVLAVGDVAMVQGEIDGVIDALRTGGFEIVALHNHMTTEEPRLFYLHFQAIGKPGELALTFRRAIDVLGHARPAQKVTAKPGKPQLNSDALSTVFGVKVQTFPSGVLRFSSPRKDLHVSIADESFLPGMGLASWAALGACECGLTMVMGDTCCLKSELQGVIGALRSASIHVTAIHNHILGASQEVIFLHYEGEGDSLALAKGIRSCWDGLGKGN